LTIQSLSANRRKTPGASSCAGSRPAGTARAQVAVHSGVAFSAGSKPIGASV
jgi:hypothetical protein